MNRRQLLGYLASLPVAARFKPLPKMIIGMDWGTKDYTAITIIKIHGISRKMNLKFIPQETAYYFRGR